MVELTAEDRMLVTLRDKGESWAKVTDMWTTITGAPPGGKSTLPNRYARLKANLTNFPEEHMDLLLAAYKKVIDQIEVEKWGRVKSAMEEDDTVKSQNYTVSHPSLPCGNTEANDIRSSLSKSTTRRPSRPPPPGPLLVAATVTLALPLLALLLPTLSTRTRLPALIPPLPTASRRRNKLALNWGC
jgi:hypothetical protein